MFRKSSAALASCLALSLANQAHATEFGLSDQQAATFADSRVRGLGLTHARLIVPWNVATADPDRVQAWLDAVAAAGLTPHIVFERQRSDRCPEAPCIAPTPAGYRAAVEAFRTRFPQVTSFTTWNEANHFTQPVARRPELAARYWTELTAACPGCTVVAGDVHDSSGYVEWLKRFKAAAPTTPRRWGLHNYADVSYGVTTGTDTMLETVPGELWIEETGGIVTLRDLFGRVTFGSSENRAAASVDQAFAIARTRPRITRMYIYHWKAHTLQDTFDAGLVRPDGTARPSLERAAANIAAAAAGRAAPPAGPSAQVKVSAQWSAARPQQLLLRLRCTAAGGDCRGMVTVVTETKRATAAKMRVTRLATRRPYRTTAARRTTTLRITVSAAARARIRAAKTRRLSVSLAARRPTIVRTDRALTLRRPAAR